MTETPTAAHSSPPPSPSARSRGPFVITMMLLASLLFLSTAGLLYYRWATTVEPNCVLIIDASPALKGAEISVDGMMLPKAHKITVGDGDRYSQAFFLDPGTYDVKVTLNGELQLATSVTMKRFTEGRLDLTKVTPTTQP